MNATKAMKQAVAKLPTKYLHQYVEGHEKGVVSRLNCAVRQMLGGTANDYNLWRGEVRYKTGVGDRPIMWPRFYSDYPLLAVEAYYEGYHVAFGHGLPSKIETRRTHIYNACVEEIAKREELKEDKNV